MMKNWLVILVAAICFNLRANADESPDVSPGVYSRFTVGAEGLGPGLYYSVFGTFRILQFLAVNGGASFFPVSDSSTSINVLTFPISVSLLLGHNGNFELNGGMTLIAASGTATVSTTNNSFTRAVQAGAVMPFFGAGYRFWPLAGGFSFRAMAYGLILPGGGTSNGFVTIPPILPWLGLSIGYSF